MNANRDPRHWDEPEQFRPERFNDPQESSKFMAFGDGPMHCIGQKLAMLEIKVGTVLYRRQDWVFAVKHNEIV